jgi:hypothetical protein
VALPAAASEAEAVEAGDFYLGRLFLRFKDLKILNYEISFHLNFLKES